MAQQQGGAERSGAQRREQRRGRPQQGAAGSPRARQSPRRPWAPCNPAQARQAIAAVRSRKGLAGDALTLDKSAEAQKSNARIKG